MQVSSLHEIARLAGCSVSQAERHLRNIEPALSLDGLRYWSDLVIPAVKSRAEGRPDHPIVPHLPDIEA